VFRKGFKGKNYTVGDDRANDMRLQRDFSAIIFIEALVSEERANDMRSMREF